MQNGRAKICDDFKNAHQIVISVHLLTKFHKKQVTICKNRIKVLHSNTYLFHTVNLSFEKAI